VPDPRTGSKESKKEKYGEDRVLCDGSGKNPSCLFKVGMKSDREETTVYNSETLAVSAQGKELAGPPQSGGGEKTRGTRGLFVLLEKGGQKRETDWVFLSREERNWIGGPLCTT